MELFSIRIQRTFQLVSTLNRVTHCLFVLNERSALRVPDEQVTIRKAAHTAPAHRTDRFH